MTTFSPWRYRLSVCFRRSGVQAPPSRSDSLSATIRSTSSRTSRRIGWNSGDGVPRRRSSRSSLIHPRQERRAATTVTAEAARARNPKAIRRNRRVLASRRWTKLRSCTRTTKPRARFCSMTGIALTCTLPPGRDSTLFQEVHEEGGTSAVARTCRPSSPHESCSGKSFVRVRSMKSAEQAAAAMTRSSWVISESNSCRSLRCSLSQWAMSACRAPLTTSLARRFTSLSNQSRVV